MDSTKNFCVASSSSTPLSYAASTTTQRQDNFFQENINAHGVGVYLCNPRPPMCRPPDCERKRKRLLGSQRCPSIGLKVLFICQELIKFERRTLDSKTRSIGYDIPDGESGESIKDFPFFCFPIEPQASTQLLPNG